MNPWLFLGAAVALEVSATSLLKLSDGFTKWHWGVASMFLYSICFWVMAPALKVIPVGVAYAIWAGLGIVAIAVVGALLFGERLGLVQYLLIAMVLVGAVGLRLTTDATV